MFVQRYADLCVEETTRREDVLVSLVELERAYLRVKLVETDRGVDDVLADELWVEFGEEGWNTSFVSTFVSSRGWL